jgi:hypothetical protein
MSGVLGQYDHLRIDHLSLVPGCAEDAEIVFRQAGYFWLQSARLENVDSQLAGRARIDDPEPRVGAAAFPESGGKQRFSDCLYAEGWPYTSVLLTG